MVANENLVCEVWVLFDHFIRSNSQDAELPLRHHHQDGIDYVLAICRCVSSFLRQNKKTPSRTSGGSLLD